MVSKGAQAGAGDGWISLSDFWVGRLCVGQPIDAGCRFKGLPLEAGDGDDYPWIYILVGYLYCIGNPRTDWMYKTRPEPGLNGRSLGYPRGRVLGGYSSINGMIYMRGQRGDYDRWAEMIGARAGVGIGFCRYSSVARIHLVAQGLCA